MPKHGRNEQCPCGSGRKFKKCCEGKTEGARMSRLLILAVGGALVAAVAAGVASFSSDSRPTTRVWDPAHGHYHDANGLEIP